MFTEFDREYEVKWLGHGSRYRILFDGDGATFLLPAKNDTRVIAGRRPLPVDRSFDRRRCAGSGLDTVLIQISGPNNFIYNAPATIAGGDVVVHP